MRSSGRIYSLHEDADAAIASSKSAARRRMKPSEAKRLGGVLIAFALLLGLCASSLLVVAAARSPQSGSGGPVTATITIASPRGDNCTRMIFDNTSGRMAKVDVVCADAKLDNVASPYRGTVDRLDRIQRSFQNR